MLVHYLHFEASIVSLAMLKMKLPMKTAKKGGDKTAGDDSSEDQNAVPRAAFPSPVYNRLVEPPTLHGYASHLNKETVFEWFGLHLNPAKRIEFMCGLLHMCQPLELRFLGSYLEDLARKDYHVLRDFECRANSLSELEVLTDVADPVVRSKLLVCLSLLGSDSRECAGILSRILSSVDLTLFCRNSSLPSSRESDHRFFCPPCPEETERERPQQISDLSSNGALEQLALLFTMASLHPAFLFHQREVIRGQLDNTQLALEERRQRRLKAKQTTELMDRQGDCLPPSVQGFRERTASPPTSQSQQEAVHIEGIVLNGISQTRMDKEYSFEVKWSDSCSSSVTKTHHELEDFLLKLPKDHCKESFEKSILRLLNQGEQYESRELEKNLRRSFLCAPPLFRQTRRVCRFFNCETSNSTETNCCKCDCQLGKAYQRDGSDASSQDEESHVQRHKKKQGSWSQCPLLPSAKDPHGDTWKRGPVAEVNGSADRRKKLGTVRSNPEAEDHRETEKRSIPVSKMKVRVVPTDRNKGNRKSKGSAFMSGGGLGPALSLEREERGSGSDTHGETSSEGYSSPSSRWHRGQETPDSEEDNNKDRHSDDSSKDLASDNPLIHHTDPAFREEVSVHPQSSSNLKAQMDRCGPETSTEFPSFPVMCPLPCVIPNGASESGLPLVSPPSQRTIPDGTLMMQMSLIPSAVQGPGILEAQEKSDVLPAFRIPPTGLHSPVNVGVQPLVQKFNAPLSHNLGSADGGDLTPAPQVSHSYQPPVRALSSMSSRPPSYSSPSVACQEPARLSPGVVFSPPHMETPVKHHGLSLPSGMPSAYTLPPVPTSIMASGAVSSSAQAEAAVSPAVTSPTPGPAPSLSPVPTHSTAQSDSTCYNTTTASCGSSLVAPGNPGILQQTQQQQPVGCGTCGCYNNCGSRGSSTSNFSGCQTPLFFSPRPMATAAVRQTFSIPPSLFHLTHRCSNSYLTQAHPPHQASGAAALPPFFPSVPPPAHPSPYLHTHPQSQADMVNTQAAVAANYSLQQPMVPVASFCQGVYQHVHPNLMGMLSAAALVEGGVNKKNGNVTCYNCGAGGHFAQDCSQPSMDFNQQGGFRLKYAASHISESHDNAD